MEVGPAQTGAEPHIGESPCVGEASDGWAADWEEDTVNRGMMLNLIAHEFEMNEINPHE